MDLLHVVQARHSSREPTPDPLRLRELAFLLGWSLGLRPTEEPAREGSRRYFPSAGARFPLECYVLALRCESLMPGVYHYESKRHALSCLAECDSSARARAIYGHEWIAESRAIVVFTAMMNRTTMKYGDRGYRFSLLEAGHAMQNICLLAAALNVRVTPVGGFADQQMTRLLDVADLDELPIYSAVLP
ncbi:SagB/ThcOx family dehydrogenase [Pendulispora albinea]|uniref:SagB/ThcOx family dehydrogenase n=2 Tax=Pendulispora albinea TaxID=2741071 RepID=A0ABZ2LY89_9BACT